MIPNDPIEHLISLLSRLPGLGRRSARRAVLKMLMDPGDKMLPLADALRAAADSVRPCEVCGNLDAASPCHICADHHRDRRLVCVVEGVADLWALERAHAHRGTGPEDLSITPLLRRIEGDGIEEVILALPATVDGATTTHYLTDRLKPTGCTITRLAQGVPIGGALDVLDDGTLTAAFKARRAL